MDNDTAISRPHDGSGAVLAAAQPDADVSGLEDILDWGNHIPIAPERPVSSIRVRLVDCGRDVPIPAEDPRDA